MGIFHYIAISIGVLILLYLGVCVVVNRIISNMEVTAGKRIRELCDEFGCDPVIFAITAKKIVIDNNFLRSEMEKWDKHELHIAVKGLLLLSWISTHKGIFIHQLASRKKHLNELPIKE